MELFHKKPVYKILIIDDESEFTDFIAQYLKSFQYKIFICHKAIEALEIAEREKPQVVLLDFRMPEINGDTFLPLIRRLSPDSKAIVVTGYTGEEIHERFEGLGYFAYFEKPIKSLEALHQKIEEAFKPATTA